MVFKWFFTFEPLVSMVFQISPIGINDFSNVFLQMNHCHWMDGLWLTIDIDGLSMVLVEVNGGSQKKAKTQKKTWFVKKTQGQTNFRQTNLVQRYKSVSCEPF